MSFALLLSPPNEHPSLSGRKDEGHSTTDEPTFVWPVACEIGKTCAVQQYPDHALGPGAKDYRCGALTYDGHDGTDIRLPSIAIQRRGVAVLAAARGIVRAVRNDEPDELVQDTSGRARLKGRECGNGVVIGHDFDWETQYCHLAKGSVSVTVGERVMPGSALGLVGLSGDTQFPHLHFSVRHAKAQIDPFAPDLAPGQCRHDAKLRTLWEPAAEAVYQAPVVLNAGIAGAAPTMAAINDETVAPIEKRSPVIAAYAQIINLSYRDVLRVSLKAPDGSIASENVYSADRNKAQWLLFAGRKRPSEGWPSGRWTMVITVERKSQIILRAERLTELR